MVSEKRHPCDTPFDPAFFFEPSPHAKFITGLLCIFDCRIQLFEPASVATGHGESSASRDSHGAGHRQFGRHAIGGESRVHALVSRFPAQPFLDHVRQGKSVKENVQEFFAGEVKTKRIQAFSVIVGFASGAAATAAFRTFDAVTSKVVMIAGMDD